MDNTNLKILKLKQTELATLDERFNRKRSTLERDLATLHEQAQEEQKRLKEEISILNRAAQIESETLSQSNTPRRRVNTKVEREELFQTRAQVMKRFLEEANGKEVHAKLLAEALHRPLSTVKDYYNEQPNIRPTECFWKSGIDNAHFTWRDGYGPNHVKMVAMQQPESHQHWH